MPTKKIYQKAIGISQELIGLGLNGWEADLTIANKKTKIATDVKIKFKLTKKLNKNTKS